MTDVYTRTRARARRNAATGLAPYVPHGKITGHTYWGCRCPDCRLISVIGKWFQQYRNREQVISAFGCWRSPTLTLRAIQGYVVCVCGEAADVPDRRAIVPHIAECPAALRVLLPRDG